MSEVFVWTDGSCIPNPGPGGWAVLRRDENGESVTVGSEANSTNNRMELTAAICALKEISSSADVHVHTDSNYVKQGITAWIKTWKRKNWLNSSGKAVKNIDLWRELDALNSRANVTWHWVKAHAGHEENEQVDRLAREAAREQVQYE